MHVQKLSGGENYAIVFVDPGEADTVMNKLLALPPTEAAAAESEKTGPNDQPGG